MDFGKYTLVMQFLICLCIFVSSLSVLFVVYLTGKELVDTLKDVWKLIQEKK